MNIQTPTTTVIYLIEQAIKEYRKRSQHRIKSIIPDITLDQCLVLMILDNDSTLTQTEIADLIFKDFASVTRMIELMVKKKYLERKIKETDRRRYDLKITAKGNKALKLITPIISHNRSVAFDGIPASEISQLEVTLNTFIANSKLI